MFPSAVRCGLLIAVAFASAGSPVAHADIYTWMDEAGKVNVSNLKPPDGARITRVVRETPRPQSSETRSDVVYQQQVQALSERVRQLEAELQATPPAPAPAPTIIVSPIVNVTMPQPMDYSIPQEAAATTSCDPSWFGCSAFLGVPYTYYAPYVSTPVVTRPNAPRRHHRVDARPHPAAYPFGSVALAPPGQVVPPIPYAPAPAGRPVFRPGR